MLDALKPTRPHQIWPRDVVPCPPCQPCLDCACPTVEQLEALWERAVLKVFRATCNAAPGLCQATIRYPSDCHCSVDRLDLCLPYPVVSVDEIVIGCETYTGDDIVGWQLEECRYLRRTGNCCVMPSQNLCSKLGDPCTWAVTVTFGQRPTDDMIDAALELWCADVAACCRCNSGPCGDQPISKEMVESVTVDSVTTRFRSGATGCPTFDRLTELYSTPRGCFVAPFGPCHEDPIVVANGPAPNPTIESPCLNPPLTPIEVPELVCDESC